MRKNRKLLVICGSTGTGKTELGIYLAKKFEGAIISADSRQAYKGLVWGTNKFGKTDEEMEEWRRERGVWVKEGVKTYLYDVVNVGEIYSVFEFVKRARKVAESLWGEGKLPIVVGGTGFYIRALTCGIERGGVPADWGLRERLGEKSVEELQETLKLEDRESFNKLNKSDRGNSRRLIRRIEIARGGGARRIERIEADVLKIGLRGEKERLFGRGDGWVEAVMRGGLVEEVRGAMRKGWGETEVLQGIIYGPVQEFLKGNLGREELQEVVKRQVRDYIKRQLTFFAKEERVEWFDCEEEEVWGKVEKRVGGWYSRR